MLFQQSLLNVTQLCNGRLGDRIQLSSVNDDVSSFAEPPLTLVHGLHVSVGKGNSCNCFCLHITVNDPQARFQSPSLLPSLLASAATPGFHLGLAELLF